MGAWIPPIPGGKLISKPVRDIGPAVVFLHWCYEAVKRDGTIEFQISDVAGYLEESYYTVRKWWSVVKDGPWFAEVTDRGRRGYKVRMADDWLEWRGVKSSSNVSQMQERAFDETEGTDEVAVKSPSSNSEMQERAFDAPAYKVLHNDQESSIAANAQSAPQPPQKKARKPKPDTTPAVIRQALAEVCEIDLKLARGEKLLNLNSAAKHLWQQQQAKKQTAEQTADAIRQVAVYCRKFAWECTKGRPVDNPAPPRPQVILDYWQEAAKWVSKQRTRTNGLNGHHTPPPVVTEDLADLSEVVRMFRQGGAL